MTLSSLEDVLTAQAYILFYRCVSLPPRLHHSISQASTASGASLRSEDTLIVTDSEDGLCRSNRSKRPLRSNTSSSQLSVPEVSGSIHSVSTIDHRTSTASDLTETYSLKVDGTLESKDNPFQNSSHKDVKSVQRTRRSLQTTNNKLNTKLSKTCASDSKRYSVNNIKPHERGASISSGKTRKRNSHSESQQTINQDSKKPRKLSFSTGAFYCSPKSGKFSPRRSVVRLRRSPRHRKAPTISTQVNTSLLERFIDGHEGTETPPLKKTKRRKSTFW